MPLVIGHLLVDNMIDKFLLISKLTSSPSNTQDGSESYQLSANKMFDKIMWSGDDYGSSYLKAFNVFRNNGKVTLIYLDNDSGKEYIMTAMDMTEDTAVFLCTTYDGASCNIDVMLASNLKSHTDTLAFHNVSVE